MKTEIRNLLHALCSQGWRIAHGGIHYKCYPPDRTKQIVVISATPSDKRALKNIYSDLRKSGFVMQQ